MDFIDKLLGSLKKNGMRKIFWALAALIAIFVLCFFRRMTGGEFVLAFGTLVGAVMAANASEHKSKATEAAPAPEAPHAP